MVFFDKPRQASSSTSNVDRLATNSYNNLVLSVIDPFAILNVQPNTLANDEHGIHITVLIARATIVPSKKTRTNASPFIPVRENPLKDFGTSELNTQAGPT